MEKVVRITCSAGPNDSLPLVAWESLRDLQGKLKKRSADQIRSVMKSIERYGFSFPFFIWKTKNIFYCMDGHGRLQALRKMKSEGWSIPKLPMVYIKAKNREEAMQKLLRLNSTYGTMSRASVLNFSGDMKVDWGEISIPGSRIVIQEISTMSNGNEVPDSVPSKVKTGDLWRMGNHLLLCGDSSKPGNAAILMKDEMADLLFTDPPYGVSIVRKNNLLKSIHRGKSYGAGMEMDDLNPSGLKDRLTQVFITFQPFMSEKCSVFVFAPQGGELGMMMMMMMAEIHLPVRHVLIWAKQRSFFSLGRLDYDYKHESILFTWVKTHKKNMGGEFHTSIWDVPITRHSENHPTIKPVELAINAILNHTDPGDIVLDMFGGVGTTLIACEKTERSCRMVEISPKYCDIVIDRYRAWCVGKGTVPTILKVKTGG